MSHNSINSIELIEMTLKSSLQPSVYENSTDEQKQKRSVYFSGEKGNIRLECFFLDTIEKLGNFSLWLMLMLILTIWPTIIIAVHNTIYSVKDILNFRCYIPELQSSSWNFEMKQNISTPNTDNISVSCFMYQINYTWLSSLPYKRALRYIDKYKHAIPIIQCSNAVSDYAYNGFTFIDNTNLQHICKNYIQRYLWISGLFGRLLTDIPVGLVADICGRKNAIQLGTCICVVGLLVTLLLKNTLALFVGRILTAGGGYSTALIFYLYFIEICSKSSRPLFGQLAFIGWGFANLLVPFLLSNIHHWWYLHASIASLIFVSLFGMWYISESPRWLLSRKWYRFTFQALCEVDDVLPHQPIIIYERPPKRPTVLHQLMILKVTALGNRINKSGLMLVTSLLTFYAARGEAEQHLNIDFYSYLIIVSAIPIINPLSAAALIHFLGRKLSVMFLYGLLVIVYLVYLFEIPYYEGHLLLYLLAVNFSIAASNIVMQHTVEMYPVSFSGTILGFCTSCATIAVILQNVLEYQAHIKSIKYVWYIMLNVAAIITVYYLPETAGKSLPLNEHEAKLL